MAEPNQVQTGLLEKKRKKGEYYEMNFTSKHLMKRLIFCPINPLYSAIKPSTSTLHKASSNNAQLQEHTVSNHNEKEEQK